ncbi:MAG TPA: penicillin acylase family protein, partial [Myxococcales bacterium]|nr:penicillin acylase family protein [Myxococcales bacterium]
MSKPLRWLLRITFALVAIAIVVAGLFATIVHRHLPGSDAPALPGLSQPMEVAFDARGVPTLKAANLLDASRALGLLHARERFFQMELQRRTARGELAEIFGKPALPSDELHRIYGFRQLAERTAAHMQPESAKHMQAYADGVNAWLSARQGKVALELTILGVRPRPWTPEDSIATLLLMHEDLSSSWRTEQRIDALKVTEARQHFFFPRVTDEDVLLIPDAAPQGNDAAKLFHAEHASNEKPVELTPGEEGTRPEFIGSNNWVIGGSRTKSGKPILANDPHLTLRLPNLWYAARIEWAGRFV